MSQAATTADTPPLEGRRVDGLLAAVDLSRDPEPVLAQAITLARGLDCQLTVLHVHAPGLAAAASEMPDMGSGPVPERAVVERTLETQRREQLDGLRARIPRDVGAVSRFEVGDPAEVVPRVAEDFDALVLGSSDRGVFARMLERDMPSRAQRKARCMTVIVPTEDE